MATYDGTNYTLTATPRIGTWPNAAQSRSARVYCMSDECYATGAGAAGSHLYFGGLPAGAVPLISILWPIDSDAVYDGADTATNAVTGELGILATTGANARAADIDLFGDITALNVAATQVIEPGPDGTIYTSTLDFALREAVTPVMTTGAAAVADTEGVALKMLYTHGGRTY